MGKYFNVCNFYILLWCLYSLQGTLYTGGSIISQGILAVLLVISLYYTIYANIKFVLPPYMKMLNIMLIMFVIYGGVLLLSNEVLVIRDDYLGAVSNKDYLKNIFISLLPIYTFFVFAKIGQLSDSVIRKWIPIFVVIVIANFFAQQSRSLAKAEELMSTQEEFTNNVGYIFLAIIPLLLFVKRTFVKYILLLVCGVFIIAAMKRGAILIFALTLPLFFNWTLKGISPTKKILISVLIVVCVCAIVYYMSYMLDTSEYFQDRINNTLAGDASGRESMYPHLLRQIFYYATPLQFLFGRGAWGTLKVSNNFAHNDWLEIGINQGVLGVVIYIVYWVAFYVTTKRMRQNNQIYAVLMLTMTILFMKTMFSMSYDNMLVYTTICIGYCMAHYNSSEQLCVK